MVEIWLTFVAALVADVNTTLDDSLSDSSLADVPLPALSAATPAWLQAFVMSESTDWISLNDWLVSEEDDELEDELEELELLLDC